MNFLFMWRTRHFSLFRKESALPKTDMLRFSAAPSDRLGHLPFESDRAFPTVRRQGFGTNGSLN